MHRIAAIAMLFLITQAQLCAYYKHVNVGEPGPSGQEPELPPTPPTRKRRRIPRSFLFVNPELPDDHPANIAGIVYQPPAQAPQAPVPVLAEAPAPSANSSVATTPEGHIYLDSPQHLGRRRRTGI